MVGFEVFFGRVIGGSIDYLHFGGDGVCCVGKIDLFGTIWYAKQKSKKGGYYSGWFRDKVFAGSENCSERVASDCGLANPSLCG